MTNAVFGDIPTLSLEKMTELLREFEKGQEWTAYAQDPYVASWALSGTLDLKIKKLNVIPEGHLVLVRYDDPFDPPEVKVYVFADPKETPQGKVKIEPLL